jgi:hypothetical protein
MTPALARIASQLEGAAWRNVRVNGRVHRRNR